MQVLRLSRLRLLVRDRCHPGCTRANACLASTGFSRHPYQHCRAAYCQDSASLEREQRFDRDSTTFAERWRTACRAPWSSRCHFPILGRGRPWAYMTFPCLNDAGYLRISSINDARRRLDVLECRSFSWRLALWQCMMGLLIKPRSVHGKVPLLHVIRVAPPPVYPPFSSRVKAAESASRRPNQGPFSLSSAYVLDESHVGALLNPKWCHISPFWLPC